MTSEDRRRSGRSRRDVGSVAACCPKCRLGCLSGRALPVLSIRRRISCKASGVSASMRMAGSSTFSTLTSSRPCSSLRAPASPPKRRDQVRRACAKAARDFPTDRAYAGTMAPSVGLRLETRDQGIETAGPTSAMSAKADQRGARLHPAGRDSGNKGGGEPFRMAPIADRERGRARRWLSASFSGSCPVTRKTGRAPRGENRLGGPADERLAADIGNELVRRPCGSSGRRPG